MTSWQRTIKYIAMAFAVLLAVTIVGGVFSAVGLFSGIFGDDGVLEDMRAYELSGNITDIKIEINAADFTVTTGASFALESNLKYLNVEEKDGCLIVTETKRFGANYKSPKLNLCIPDGFVFGEADVITGAGRVTVTTLSASELNMELGAGEVTIDSLTATAKADIDGGAGRLTIREATLTDLTLNMGIGELSLTAAVYGNSEIDYGIGSAELVLAGAKEDYRIEIDKGLGKATVDGQEMNDGSVYGNGVNRIDIDGGIGELKITFQQN